MVVEKCVEGLLAEFYVLDFSIAPEFLQVVEGTLILLKNVTDYIQVIEENPLLVLESLFMPGILPAVLVNLLHYRIGDGINLRVGAAGTDDKIVGNGVFYFAEVENGNVQGLFLQHPLDHEVCKLAGADFGFSQKR